MPFRVVQWTTGKTGTAAVRGMVGHPELDLVGCYAYSADKVGQERLQLFVEDFRHLLIGPGARRLRHSRRQTDSQCHWYKSRREPHGRP